MKSSAKAQHEIDRAEFEAIKAESRANFEENRGHNSIRKSKERSKAEHDERIRKAEQRKKAADERYNKARSNK